MQKLRLGWAKIDADHVALIFDKEAWQALQMVAQDQELDTRAMIVEAIANLLGTIVGQGPAH